MPPGRLGREASGFDRRAGPHRHASRPTSCSALDLVGVDEQFTETVSEMPACTQAICARAAVSALTGGRAMARTRNGPTSGRDAMRGHYRERSLTAVNGQKRFPRSAQSGAPTTPPLPHRPEFVVDGQRVVNNQILSFIPVPRTKLNPRSPEHPMEEPGAAQKLHGRHERYLTNKEVPHKGPTWFMVRASVSLSRNPKLVRVDASRSRPTSDKDHEHDQRRNITSGTAKDRAQRTSAEHVPSAEMTSLNGCVAYAPGLADRTEGRTRE